ncbi:MAG TPA: hypothetical protein VI728_13000, partial [Syntrophales bacterium]|nr:hypothetical protein [Syntrophales bacterium]
RIHHGQLIREDVPELQKVIAELERKKHHKRQAEPHQMTPSRFFAPQMFKEDQRGQTGHRPEIDLGKKRDR